MPYRYRPPMYNRRYQNTVINKTEPTATVNNSNINFNNAASYDDTNENLIEIPMPNEIEIEVEDNNKSPQRSRGNRISSLFNFIKDRIHIDDIIVIGLIFLVLDEGLDDDFLLILLLYIFLF